MEELKKIIAWIEDNTDKIVDTIKHESIDVYKFLQEQFEKTENVEQNYLFQFTYRSFYRMDNAGLSDAFKKDYFRLMNKARRDRNISLKDVVEELFEIDREIQFSFATKLCHTINNNMPIYDSMVAELFDFKKIYHIKNTDKKIERYIEQYDRLKAYYSIIISEKMLDKTIQKFEHDKLSHLKKIDFVLWSAGKLKLSKKSLSVAP